MSNTELWDAVCETDPKHTKKVQFGRGFTAIDPMWQVYNATKQFGPAGRGWGWEVRKTEFLPTNYVGVLVRVWHGSQDNYIEQYGQCGLYIDKALSKPDEDCMKKAVTDGLTKCLSYFGFNADVFLGKFDDNKYVQEMADKHVDKDAKEMVEYLLGQINKCKTIEALEELKPKARQTVSKFDMKYQKQVGGAFTIRAAEIEKG